MFCRECGRKTTENLCPYCKQNKKENISLEFIDFEKNNLKMYSNRSWLVAGIFQMFLGVFGVGRFYLGYIRMGIFQILISLITLGLGGFIWGIVDGIIILTGREKYDSKGRLLI